MARFVNAQVPEVVQPFWAALQAGEFIADAAAAAGTYRKQGTRWVAVCGGVRPRRGRNLKGRCLSFAEREEIALGRARGETIRVIARRLGRSPSTISRELRRNVDRDGGYRATRAHARAYERASRPEAGQAGDEPAAAGDRAGRSGSALLARADRRAAAPPVPR
jgi:DNA-binding NarL/FixJ family response regulator